MRSDGLSSDAHTEPANGTSVFVFVDTNVLLQLKNLSELPWNDVCPGPKLVLLVPRAVQKEVSRLKGDGKSRRSKRAQTAAKLLMQVAQSLEGAHTVRGSHPGVELRLPPHGAAPPPPHPDPDLKNTDDQIIEEILQFQAAHPGTEVAFLTTDSDQVVSCKHFGIRFIVVPEDWHLPPEPDERDKRIRELERRVAQLEAKEPTIAISWLDPGGQPIDVLTIEAQEYAPIPPELLDELVADAKRRSPPAEGLDELVGAKRPADAIDKTVLLADPRVRFEPPTRDEVSDYRDKDYPAWLDRVRKFFETLPERMAYTRRVGRLTAALRNEGARPAEGTIVTFTALGGIRLIREGHGARGDEERFPAPPRPPKGVLVSRGPFPAGPPYDSTLPRMPRFGPHGPHAFYLTQGDRTKPSDQWVFECDEFLHGGCEETFEVSILVPYGAKPVNSAIRCNVLARNMSAPAEAIIPIKVVSRAADSLQAARDLLERHLRPKPEVWLDLPDT